MKSYAGTQKSIFLNLIYQNQINDYHRISFGISGQDDDFWEHVGDTDYTFLLLPLQRSLLHMVSALAAGRDR